MKPYTYLVLLICILNFDALAQKSIPIYPLKDFTLTTDAKWLGAAFDSKIRDEVKVVGLGEVSHGSTELFQFKIKMIQYLVEEKGYRQLQFEYPNAAIELLNRYLHDGAFNEPAVLQVFYGQIFGRIIRDKSFFQLFVWIKRYNLTHPTDQINLVGFDIAGAAGSFVNYFKRRFNLEKSTIIELDTIKWRTETTEKIAIRLINYISKRTNSLQKSLGADYPFFENAVKNAAWEIEFNKLYKSNSYKASVFRDSLMAVNILALNKDRSILWAHNLHVTTAKLALSFGNYLSKKIGNEYYVLLTDFAEKADVVVWNSGTFPVKEIKADKKTLASQLYRKYDSTNGVIFYDEVMKRKLLPNVGFIDRNGKYYFTGTGKPFDALVVFKDLNPVEN